MNRVKEILERVNFEIRMKEVKEKEETKLVRQKQKREYDRFVKALTLKAKAKTRTIEFLYADSGFRFEPTGDVALLTDGNWERLTKDDLSFRARYGRVLTVILNLVLESKTKIRIG